MTYKDTAIKILKEVRDSLTFPVEIMTAVNIGGGKHTLTVCDMYHAQPGFDVTIGGKTYKITDIIPSVSSECGSRAYDVMKVKGDAANITATTFDMYPLFFFYGTPIAQGVELIQENKATSKTPMYWLRLDDISTKFYEDDLDVRECDIDFTIYPLTQSDHELWLTDRATKEAVTPMHRAAQLFVKGVKAKPERFKVDDMTWDIPEVFPKFGVISINRGVEKSWWHDKLGGVALKMSLTVFKRFTCDDCES